MFLDGLSLRGKVILVLYGPNGEFKGRWVYDNLIVNAGKNAVAGGTALSAFTHIGIGTGTTAPSATDTTLQTEVGTRVLATQTNPSPNVRRYVSLFGPNNPSSFANITEAGLFTASTGGTMFARQVFTAKAKETTDSLEVTWEITVS